MSAIDPNSRDRILARIRRSIAAGDDDTKRRVAVQRRLATPAPGPIPARARVGSTELINGFQERLEAQRASVERIGRWVELPRRIVSLLRSSNLPMRLQIGADRTLAELPWHEVPTLALQHGRADGTELAGLSHAYAAAAETGTLALVSGPDNPTTLNFLPETHIVVIAADRIFGPYEAIWQALRRDYGDRQMPRTVNLISGPSRTADIEQTMVMGAHGPRRLHVLIVEESQQRAD